MAEPLDSRFARQALQLLESMQGAGIQQLPQPRASRPLAKPQEEAPATPSSLATVIPPISAAPLPAPEAATIDIDKETVTNVFVAAPNLKILQDEVAACTQCHELTTTRTQTVFGVGNPQARLCFLGEAPGADEDRMGEPFVGRAGQLLNKIIEACRLKREEVYILNVIKCRPPGNRNPTPEEASNCRPFLDRQLELIQPEFICCLGSVATQNLLSTTAPMSRMRGQVHNYQGIKVVCTYHPAYLLRNPAAKKDTWEDMKFLMREMGAPVD
jgi:DNA polymerase